MANEWKWLRNGHGAPLTVVVTAGSAALTNGQPLKVSSNVAEAVGDGETVDLVAYQDADASADLVAILPIGDVFEVTTNADLGAFDRAYPAASNKIDAGSSGNISNMFVVDGNPASGGLARVAVFSNFATAVTHTA
jgi:hypothetical protein